MALCKYRIGLDIGSTTAKMVVVDAGGHIVWSRYERHNAQVKELLCDYLDKAMTVTGDAEVALAVTGSVGMATAEILDAEFVQEVVAASTYARERHPEARALIDIGGEDSKVVVFDGAHTDLRMNGNCAGGTGAFIDQMAMLTGTSHERLSQLAMQSTRLYTIAARCGVFAKTDVQNLISRNVPSQDIAASIFHSIAVQTITTLAHGQEINPPILLCGGPLTFLPALRKAFADYLGISESSMIVSAQSNLIPAIGCALRGSMNGVRMSVLRHRMASGSQVNTGSSLPPLFVDSGELSAWQQSKSSNTLALHPMQPHEDVVIGIDSGSTTTKIIAARPNGDVLYSHYAQSLGQPINAVADGLRQLSSEAKRQGCDMRVVGTCSTGYGEELIKAAFGLDTGIIETMAHYTAAKRMTPGVSFVLDIGGQDMKAIFVDKGVVTRMELNEACSSGCGTFLQTFAQSLGHSVEQFAAMACHAKHPCDLGTRCTVFMNSKIKQALREGADIADISAGLSYSVINNCLYKVLKLKDLGELGDHIVVQGGTMRNDAVVRALELLTGKSVTRSSCPEMMGAYGCALYAMRHQSAARTIDDLTSAAGHTTHEMQCHGCENNCGILRYRFGNGTTYYSGNKCERVFNNNGTRAAKGRNIYNDKHHLLFDRDVINDANIRIGIPRVLNMYENYPFWNALLTHCGIGIVLSPESTMTSYESALGSVMSDNICFPAKLVHSHVSSLVQSGVDRILMPYVVHEKQDCSTAINSYNCPIVSGYSDVIRSAMSPGVPIDSPVLSFADKKMLDKQVSRYLKTLGIPTRTARKALSAAIEAQEQYERDIRQSASDILAEGRDQGRLTILLAGRPYHTDPLVQHRLSDMIAALGVNVISDDIVRHTPEVPDGETNTVRQWAYVNRIIKSAQWAATEPKDVQFVEMTSFGCGPDAFIQDEVRELLSRHGKALTLLKIDDVSNVGSLKLRVRSLTESLRQQYRAGSKSPEAFGTTRTYTPSDRHKKILAPHISEYITPLLPALGKICGYDIEVLPPSGEESALAGLRHANNEVCYPATLIVGDIIRALDSGRYDLDQIAVAMSQTGGQCRATNYAGLIKRAMVQAGYGNVPLITLGVATTAGGGNEQEGFDVPWLKLAPMMLHALLYADTIAKMYYASVVREKEPGGAAKLRDQYLEQGAAAVSNKDSGLLRRLTESAANDFDALSRDAETRKVGIVGEIFLKFNHFAHQSITDSLISRGIEVVPPLITPFFLQEFVNVVRNKMMGLTASRMPSSVIKMLYQMVMHRINRINQAASRYRYFRPFSDIRDEARKADAVVSPAAQFGEGWLLPGEVIEMADAGVKDIISLQPFGCIANHIVAKGIEKAIHKLYPDVNLLNLDFDSGVSSVNVANRILLFLDSVGERAAMTLA